MKNCPIFALLLSLLIAAGATTDTFAQDPFEITNGSSFAASSSRAPEQPRKSITPAAAYLVSDVKEALELIRKNHTSGSATEDAALIKSAINSMLTELDPHSTYFDPTEFKNLLSDQDSEYSGTGSTISNFLRNGNLETYVISIHPDSPAAKAHLQYGDKILAVDGVFVGGLDSSAVRDRVRGPRGTTVRMIVERAATGKLETLELRRDRVSQPSIANSFIVRDGVGYIELSEGFSHTTATELELAMTELYRRGMTSLILDLRGNGGGVLQSAVAVAEKFLPAGSAIISERGRNTYNVVFRSANRKAESLPLVVLVDRRTASASEVVAGALQDNDRALIIGQTTFGKGLVQDVVSLPSGSGMTLTTARYYTPSGRSIQRSYANSGVYDYYTHTAVDSPQRSAAPESRTLTNRPVYGGRGITPDEVTTTEQFDAVRAKLIDPIFFFVRDVVNRKADTTNKLATTRDDVRQSIIFEHSLDPELLAQFRSYALKQGGKLTPEILDREKDFIAEQLQYYFALATFGPEAASHARIRSDKEVAKAIEALPRSAMLARAAERVRVMAGNKKTRRVAFPTGQGRNRRN